MTAQETAHLIAEDKKKLDVYVYTPWREAVAELRRRRKDPKLAKRVRKLLPHGVPAPLKDAPCLVLFRHIATPNYEINRFMACADSITDFKTLILEYGEDKFIDRNQGKYYLGKMRFYRGLNKHGDPVHENIGVIDFNASNTKPINTLKTKWDDDFVEFHHNLFDNHFPEFTHVRHDISSWLHKHGERAGDYYKSFLSLFVRDGILFENFLLDKRERGFTEKIILPTLLEIERETGYKPLIVTMAPTTMEEDAFWYSYPEKVRERVLSKLGTT